MLEISNLAKITYNASPILAAFVGFWAVVF